jgi:adenylate kinase
MFIAITGTPGTGKTTVSRALRERGHVVIDLNEHIRTNGLLGEYDADRDTYDVDIGELNRTLACCDGSVTFAEGHLSHFLDCDMIIVLRCSPSVLYERLCARGYPHEKVIENVHAEALDVILCESVCSGVPVYETDCTSSPVSTAVSDIERIIAGETEGYMPGSVDWGKEMIKWF